MSRNAARKKQIDSSPRSNAPGDAPTIGRQIMQAGTFQMMATLQTVDDDRKPTRNDLKRAVQLLKQGSKQAGQARYDDAALSFLQAHKLDPANADTLLVLGNNLRHAGQIQAAVHVMEKALKVSGEDPEIIYGVGLLAQDLGMLPAAENMFALIMQRTPDDSRGPIAMASAKRASGNYEAAIDTLKFAVQGKPEDHTLWQALGVTVAEAQGVEAARPFFEEALRLQPTFDIAFANLGHALTAEGRFTESLPYLDKAVQMRPDDADTRFNYATSLLGTGDFARGWEQYEWRLDRKRGDSVVFVHDLPRWQGEDISDKTLLISDEQGIGDAIIFASAFQEVIDRAGHVIIECDHRLVSWFQRSFPAATVHRHITFRSNNKIHRHYGWLKDDGVPQPDLFIPSGSIFSLLRPDLESFDRPVPYLTPDPERVAFWKQRFDALGPGPKVGLCWSGGFVTPIRSKGYMSLSDFAPFFDLKDKGAHFIDVMYKDASEDRTKLKAEFGVDLHDWDDIDRRNQIDEAAAYTAALDFVVSISSSPVAIAGAMGVPTVTLLHKADRFHFGAGIEPWFPKAEIFVAANRSEWPAVPCRAARDATARRLGLTSGEGAHADA
ncbi:MAG: tetratricopeptide repeat-containing glycosyltransferase family protein [Minwuia sp.]|nr:tetratricopeptide repeat-containing glycosyltransferase family protein [Minwuia sp.]